MRGRAAAALGDAALAAVGLAVVVAAAVRGGVPPSPLALGVGAVAAVALELLASARAARVRALWTRRGVRPAAVAVVAVATVALPAWGLNALAGGLLAYLALVALVAAGVLPPSTAWFDRAR